MDSSVSTSSIFWFVSGIPIYGHYHFLGHLTAHQEKNVNIGDRDDHTILVNIVGLYYCISDLFSSLQTNSKRIFKFFILSAAYIILRL